MPGNSQLTRILWIKTPADLTDKHTGNLWTNYLLTSLSWELQHHAFVKRHYNLVLFQFSSGLRPLLHSTSVTSLSSDTQTPKRNDNWVTTKWADWPPVVSSPPPNAAALVSTRHGPWLIAPSGSHLIHVQFPAVTCVRDVEPALKQLRARVFRTPRKTAKRFSLVSISNY